MNKHFNQEYPRSSKIQEVGLATYQSLRIRGDVRNAGLSAADGESPVRRFRRGLRWILAGRCKRDCLASIFAGKMPRG